ncbi:AKT-interacting protein-like isoform X2 [Watersipora subatra]|uniref:AKT-interacting protein-like isoform X2 n=1 Tax=Watersipora subatra TaxID=2589382 RepID=UPI00355C074B
MEDRSSQSGTPNSSSTNDSSKENSRVYKKRMPSIDMATQAKLAQRMIDPKTATPKGGHSYGPYFLEYCLMAEYDLLHKQKSLSGVYVIPSALTPLIWNGCMFIRQGLYQGGVYRFQLFVPDTYPDAGCPLLIFDPPIFHPLIDPATGRLDVQRAFPKWKRHVNHLWQVLMYAKRSFYKIDVKDPLNPEAAKLHGSDIEFYRYKLNECNNICLDKIYDPPKSEDPHLFRFEPWDNFKHGDARKEMLNDQKVNSTGAG